MAPSNKNQTSKDSKYSKKSILSAPLGGMIQFVIKYRFLVLLLALIGVGLGGIVSYKELTFKNKRLDLINPQSGWNQYWLEYIDKFGSADDLIIVVDGKNGEDIIAAVNDAADRINAHPDVFYSLFYRFDDSILLSKALHYASDDELRGLQVFLKTNEGVFQQRWDFLAVDKLLNRSSQILAAPPDMIGEKDRAQAVNFYERVLTSLEGVFAPEYQFISPFPDIDIASRRNSESGSPEANTVSDSPMARHLNHQPVVPSRTPTVFPPESAAGASQQIAKNQNEFQEILPVGSYMSNYPTFQAGGADSQELTEAPDFHSFIAYRNAPSNEAPTTDASGNIFDSAAASLAREESVLPMVGNAPEPILPSNIHYTWLAQDKTAIMMVKMKEEGGESFARGTKGIELIRTILHDVGKENRGVKLQLTGLPVMENDEMSSSQSAMSLATWLSILGVTLLYMIFFRGLRHPVMAVFALFVGLGWSMFYITCCIGHLNILSISFAVILIGLGIDFGIHYSSRYLQCRREGDDVAEALVRSGREIGPGIFTGALTTAAAFFMAGLTEFTGVAELGIIAGGGIILCCFSALTILPILIYMMDKNRPAEKLPAPVNPNVGLSFFQLHPRVTLPVLFCVILALGYGAKDLKYDYNLLNLQAEGLESVELETRLLEESKQSVWFALSMTKDRTELLNRIEKFQALPSVERVEQIATLIPEESEARLQTIRQIHECLGQTPETAGSSPVASLQAMDASLNRAIQILQTQPQFKSLLTRTQALKDRFFALDFPEYFPRMQNFQQSLGNDLISKFQALRAISSPEAPVLADLPKPYVERFMAEDGTFLMKVYGKGDLWDMDNLKQFVSEVRSVDASATGNPLQTYECSIQMRECYEKAAWFALAIVIFLLYLDLRSVRHTFLALAPVGLGMLCTFGIMGYIGVCLNAANMIVLPLIIGIGIDDGVHIVHDFRHQHARGFYRLTSSTAMSIILTSLTTIMGFGTLGIADHRGLQSLGIVLSLGVTCCWLTSLLLLPAMLSVFCKFAEEGREPESESPDESQRILKEQSTNDRGLRVTRYSSVASDVVEATGRAA